MEKVTSDSFCIDNIFDEDENVREVILRCVNRKEYDQRLLECVDLHVSCYHLCGLHSCF